jgi:DNA-binding transcriptional ArsR family regulator
VRVPHRVPPPPDIDDPRYVKAMSHPLRVRILALLQERPASPVELARWLHATVGTVAYHVRTLRSLGLIELVSETRVRGGLAYHYRPTIGPLVSPRAWADASPVAKQAAVGASLDTIADYALAAAAKAAVGASLDTIADYARGAAATGGFDTPSAPLARVPMRLDPQGWQEASEACLEVRGRLDDIAAAAAERLERDPHRAGVMDASAVLLLFESVRLTDSTG